MVDVLGKELVLFALVLVLVGGHAVSINRDIEFNACKAALTEDKEKT